MRIDKEVEKIMNDQLIRARDLLTKYKPVLDAIAIELMRTESIEREEFEKLLALHGIKAKRKAKEEVYVAPLLAEIVKADVLEGDKDDVPDATIPANPAPTPSVTVTSEVVVSNNANEQVKQGKKKDKK